MNIRAYPSVAHRRQALEKELRVDLGNVGSFTLDESVASSRNCENMIGATQIPMGIAGPLRIGNKHYYLPLATTEGALVASVSRGCKAITESGGTSVLAVRIGATRGPVFKVKNMEENSRLFEFVMSHKAKFNQIAKTTSGHIALTNVETNSAGLYRFIRFTFDTQDAMGLNMVTFATQKIVKYIESQLPVRCVALAGNYDVDKKPSWLNMLHGRGTEVWAEVTLPAPVLRAVLKTTAQRLYDVWIAKCMIGSALSGSMGFNAQYANIIAALFIATGQDPAHVTEGSVGITTADVQGKDLYVSVYLPDVMVGTVGGGTGLATQKEALSIIGAKTGQEFAEVVAGSVLAGEISLLASLSEGTLARAHERYGRNR